MHPALLGVWRQGWQASSSGPAGWCSEGQHGYKDGWSVLPGVIEQETACRISAACHSLGIDVSFWQLDAVMIMTWDFSMCGSGWNQAEVWGLCSGCAGDLWNLGWGFSMTFSPLSVGPDDLEFSLTLEALSTLSGLNIKETWQRSTDGVVGYVCWVQNAEKHFDSSYLLQMQLCPNVAGKDTWTSAAAFKIVSVYMICGSAVVILLQ